MSDRRLSRCAPVAHPAGSCEVAINRQGDANAKGLHAYVSYALGGWKVGLQPLADGTTRVWFLDVPLGVFVPGRDRTIQPWIAGAETNPVSDVA